MIIFSRLVVNRYFSRQFSIRSIFLLKNSIDLFKKSGPLPPLPLPPQWPVFQNIWLKWVRLAGTCNRMNSTSFDFQTKQNHGNLSETMRKFRDIFWKSLGKYWANLRRKIWVVRRRWKKFMKCGQGFKKISEILRKNCFSFFLKYWINFA